MTEKFILRHAPEIRIHPEEKYYPMDPMEFIQTSRFRHHIGSKNDRGWNKKEGEWIRSNSHALSYYDIPVSIISSYRLHDNGKNRRPRDKNRGKKFNVFIQPKNNPIGTHDPTRTIPVFYYLKKKITRFSKRSCYLLSYWFFYGYNDGWGKRSNHQGDWEHITLVFSRRKKLHGIYMAAHGKPTFYNKNEIKFNHSHPIIYSAKGSHASYNEVGDFHTIGVDKTSDGGYKWKTWLHCLALNKQEWRHFAGAWGEVGTARSTTGPLGPWQKRRRV